MNQRDFMKRISVLSRLCGAQLTQEIIELYDKSLRQLGYTPLCGALDEIMQTRKARDRFPSIAEMKAKITHEIDEESIATDVAGRIITGITKFGWNNQVDAKKYIGDIGWYVVENSGGWETVCAVPSMREIPMHKAQYRQQALYVIRAHKAGRLGKTPMLEDIKQTVIGPSKVADLLKIRGTHNGNKEGND